MVAAQNEEDENDGADQMLNLWGACQRAARNDMLGSHGRGDQKMRADDIGTLCLHLLRKLAAVVGRNGGRWLRKSHEEEEEEDMACLQPHQMGVKWESPPPLSRGWKPSLQCGCKGWSQNEGIRDRWRRKKRKKRRRRQEEWGGPQEVFEY